MLIVSCLLQVVAACHRPQRQTLRSVLLEAGRATCLPSSDVRPAKLAKSCFQVSRITGNQCFSPIRTVHLSLFLTGQSFPTPMEEPRKVLKAQYIGSMQVRRPSGMETLNDAIDQMISQVPPDQWREVNVAVAPSVVTITDSEVSIWTTFNKRSFKLLKCKNVPQDEERIIVESRVRFLSFLGIGRQVEHCGFIVHTANDVYIAHVLCCHPSSGAICKTIEAACQVLCSVSFYFCSHFTILNLCVFLIKLSNPSQHSFLTD